MSHSGNFPAFIKFTNRCKVLENWSIFRISNRDKSVFRFGPTMEGVVQSQEDIFRMDDDSNEME